MIGVLRWVGPLGMGAMSMTSVALCESKQIDLDQLYENINREKVHKVVVVEEETELEKLIAQCRESVSPVKNVITESTSSVVNTVKKSTCTVLRDIDWLQKSAPPEVKIGSIVGSGVVGMLMGLRRGLFRKLIYGFVWSASAGALIYPGDAKVVVHESIAISKTYSALIYNFIVGAKPTKKEGQGDKK